MKKKYSKPVTEIFAMYIEGIMRENSWKPGDQSGSMSIINGQPTGDPEHKGWINHPGGPEPVFKAKSTSLWGE
jgi:hypothetical protein